MILTTRDFEILEFLYHQGVGTFSQIRERFFSNNNSASIRLYQLRKNGFIESKRITELKTVSKSLYINAKKIPIFNTHSDLHKFKVYLLGERVRYKHQRNEGLSQPIMWKHQIELNQIRKVLEKELPGAKILGDPEIRSNFSSLQLAEVQGYHEAIADLHLEKGRLKVAVELERNLKSELEYYSRFLSYRDSSYTHVIYYCENEKVFDSISRQASSFFKIGVSLVISPKKIFQRSQGFQTLDQFLSQ